MKQIEVSEWWKKAELHIEERCKSNGCGSRPKQKAIPEAIRNAVKARYFACANCESTDDLQVDHLIPQSRGGCHSIHNLTVLCARCNLSKRDLLMSEWVFTGLWWNRTPYHLRAEPWNVYHAAMNQWMIRTVKVVS